MNAHHKGIPPIAVALAVSADGAGQVPDAFSEVYRQMPEMLRTIADGAIGTVGRVHHYSVIRGLADAAIERSRAGETPGSRLVSDAMALLDAANPDMRADVEAAFGTAGFYTGLAFACYVLLDRRRC